MPVIQLQNPLTAASEAVGGYTAQKNENADRAEAKRQRDATLALERERLASQEKYQASSLDLASKAQDDAHLRTLTDVESARIHNKIAEATADFEKQMRPVTIALAQAQLKAQTDANARAPLQEALLRFQVQGAKVDLDLKKKYGPQNAELAIQTGQANLKLIAAEIVSQQASAYRTMHPVNPGGVGMLNYQEGKTKELQIKTLVQRVKSNPVFQALPPVLASHMIKDLNDGVPPDEVLLNVRATVDPTTNKPLDESVVAKAAQALGIKAPSAPAPQQGGPDFGGMLRGAAQMINPYIGR